MEEKEDGKKGKVKAERVLGKLILAYCERENNHFERRGTYVVVHYIDPCTPHPPQYE